MTVYYDSTLFTLRFVSTFSLVPLSLSNLFILLSVSNLFSFPFVVVVVVE